MITIVGNGAIGNLLTVQCHNQGLEYQVISRGEPLEKIECSGLLHAKVKHPNVVSQETSIDSGILIMPLKAYQIVSCIEQLKQQISPEVSVILLHNGMGTHQDARALLPNNNIAVATTSYAAFKTAKQHLEVTGIGKTQAGWLSGRSGNSIHQSAFSQLIPPCSWHVDIEPMLWRKLAVNAIINPLTAIFNIPNGELCKPIYQPQIQQLATEISAVMAYLHIDMNSEQIIAACLEVARTTASNYSSMHQDILKARPTEADFINGYVVSVAKRLNLPVPLNQAMWLQIKKMEA